MTKLKIEYTKNNQDFDSIEYAYNLGINECTLESFWEKMKKNLPVKFETGTVNRHYFITYKECGKLAAAISF